jgi:hypothetical protein
VVSTAGDQMATSHQRAQRRADASGASLISVSASSGAEGAVVFNTVINDDSTRRRAEDLDAEARLLRPPGHPGGAGPGYYVDLFRGMAAKSSAGLTHAHRPYNPTPGPDRAPGPRRYW